MSATTAPQAHLALIDGFRGAYSLEGYWELLQLVQNSVITAAVLGLMGGIIGLFISAAPGWSSTASQRSASQVLLWPC